MPTNALHTAFKDASLEEQQLALIASSPELLREEDDSWEGWLPLHNAARWCASGAATSAALAAYPDAAKTASRGGYEALHLAAMGGAVAAVKALIAVYPEGALKKDGNGRTPLDEGREGSSSQHGEIVELLLALPGVREADEAEAAMKEQRARELMRPDDAPALDVEMEAETEAEADVDMAEADADADGLGLVAAGRAIASRMLRAASNALWRSTPEGDVRRAEVGAFFSERAKYIPLRLQMRERKLLRLVEAVLHVSHYTDRVDDNKLAKSVAKRTQMKLRELQAVMSGMLLACDYEAGQYAMKEGSYEDFAEFFAELFEVTRRYKIMNPEKLRLTGCTFLIWQVTRRYKIMNPEKLRDNYGKLMHLLMDANSPAMQEELDFSVVRPIKTVYSHLEEKGVLGLLADERMAVATQVVAPEPGKSRGDIRREIKEKEAAIEYLARRYHTRELPAEDLKQCLYSIGDNNAYLLQARDPCDRMIAYLREYFPADGEPSAHTSLAISGGEGGARLSHSHQRQRAFVLQSLTLWREIANDMFRLWYLAEDDMLRPGNECASRSRFTYDLGDFYL